MPRRAALRQVGHDLADDAAELVAVAGEPGGDGDLGMRRVVVEDEVAVRAVGEQAGLEHQGRSGTVGEVAPGEGPEQLFVLRLGLAVHRVGIDLFPPMMVLPELEAGNEKAGEAVVAAFLHFQVEDREGARREVLGAGRLEPCQHLPLRRWPGRPARAPAWRPRAPRR